MAGYLQRIRIIGRRTLELQRALASRSDLPDFAPEPITPADVAGWNERLLDRSRRTLEMLSERRADFTETIRSIADRMLNEGEQIAAHVAKLLPVDSNVLKIRHHGDFHLGQILIAKDDAFILDFEGEPRRPLSERRYKAPAARDIAGLIRSIDYSTTSALLRASGLTPEERIALAPKLETWREKATLAFWEASRETDESRLWPPDEPTAQRMLDFFLLEKAFYEIEYELTNRPSWLNVPLDGMWRILVRHGVVHS